MFFGVTQPFTVGEEIPVQLTFANAGVIDVNLQVRAGAMHGGGH
jgi:copper(I)-binding protein